MDSPAQPHQLPQEILDIIIDDNSHDEAMHKILALVSKSFLLQSRKHFFRDIRFQGDDGECRALQARFWEILNANPDIASYIRNVHIEDNASSETLGEDHGERPSWIREEETFQGILLVLAKNQISHLTLDIDLDWTSFPIGLQHALTQILTCPSLANLDLSALTSLPVSCCTHFPRLKHLRISGIVLVESEDRHQREAATVSISSLIVARLKGRSAQLFRNILGLGTTGIPLAFLEELRISTCDAGFTREVIWAARKSLRCLTLSARRDTDVINLSDLESLNRLELKVYSHEDYQTGVLGVLETGGPNKELRTIHITLLQVSYRSWVDHFSHEATGSFWRSLATTLDRFSSIMELVIELAMFRDEGSYLGEEQTAGLERSVRNGLVSAGGNFGSVNRVLLVEISQL